MMETDMIQDRLTAKFLNNKTATPKAKVKTKPVKVDQAPVDVAHYVGERRTTVWL